MPGNSKIEWTQVTWNPITGCSKISAGCKHCYAERFSKRLQAMEIPNYINGFKVTTHEHVLRIPLGWRKPRLVFVNSMSDLFHDDVPFSFIERTFGVMERASVHQFQILTKRSKRLRRLSPRLEWPDNVWMGVTVESDDYLNRIEDLLATDAQIKFLSFEPLLSPLYSLSLDGIDWVIVGGESGPGARPMGPGWVRDIKDQCIKANIPFFFKQWGGVHKKKSGRLLDGRTWDEMPGDKILKKQKD